MFWTRVASRKRLSLYDVRKKTKLDDLYAFPPGEVCGGMTKSTHSPYQVTISSLKTLAEHAFYTVLFKLSDVCNDKHENHAD